MADCSWPNYKTQAGTQPQPYLWRGGWGVELAVNPDGPEKTPAYRTSNISVRTIKYSAIAY